MHFVVYQKSICKKEMLKCSYSAHEQIREARDAEIRCAAENLRLSVAAVLFLFSVEVHLRIAVAISGNNQ